MTLKSIMAHFAIVVLVVMSGALADAAAGIIQPDVAALALTQAVTATSIAGTGNLSNNPRSHAPIWNPIVANVGFQDLSGISLSTRYPSPLGFNTPTTTFPRKAPSKPDPIAVPDQSSSLLLLGMGLGMLGLIGYRRKKE
jgi:hypothetical protein